jgi:hypothetical protein
MVRDAVLTEAPMHEGRELPSFSLREIDLPDVRVWEVGGKYYLIVGVEMIGKRERKGTLPEDAPKSDEGKIDGDFKMTSVQELPEKESAKMERKAFEGALAKAKSGK